MGKKRGQEIKGDSPLYLSGGEPEVYSQTTYYDQYGRAEARTDRTDHGYGPESHDPHLNPHTHILDPTDNSRDTGIRLEGEYEQ